MLDHGNAQLSAVGFYNPTMGQQPLGEFFGGAVGGMAGPFEMSGADIVNNYLAFGRTTVSCADVQNIVPEVPAGWIVAEVTHGNSSAGLSLAVVRANSLPDNTLDKTYVPLYKAVDGAWADLRWRPVVCGLE